MKIEGKNLTKVYQGQEVLHGIDLVIEDKSCLGIMGESGSGKSTLARLLAGLEQPDGGQILYQGRELKDYRGGEKKQLRRDIQVVFQNAFGAVNPNFTVEDVLREPIKIRQKHGNKRLLKSYLQLVGLENIQLKQMARSLSGGQLQRLCIARSLLMEPDVLVLDEALSGLDYLVQKQVLRLLGDLKTRFHLTYIFIVHDFLLAYYLCDQVLFLDQGKEIDLLDLNQDVLEIHHPITKNSLKNFLDSKPSIHVKEMY